MADMLIYDILTGKIKHEPLTGRRLAERATERQNAVNRENTARDRDLQRQRDIADLKAIMPPEAAEIIDRLFGSGERG